MGWDLCVVNEGETEVRWEYRSTVWDMIIFHINQVNQRDFAFLSIFLSSFRFLWLTNIAPSLHIYLFIYLCVYLSFSFFIYVCVFVYILHMGVYAFLVLPPLFSILFTFLSSLFLSFFPFLSLSLLPRLPVSLPLFPFLSLSLSLIPVVALASSHPVCSADKVLPAKAELTEGQGTQFCLTNTSYCIFASFISFI